VPVLVPDVKDLVDISCGANHVLARSSKGKLWVWGNGQQNQLGRRVVERSKLEALVPRELGIYRKKITAIGAGAYHSFAIDDKNNVYSWGLNSFGECGIELDPDNEESSAIVSIPTKVPSLVEKNVCQISGGSHHSAAVTTDGKMLVWGRMDGGQLGLGPDAIKALPEDHVVKDTRGQPRILAIPQALPQLENEAVWAACGSDHTIGITKAGKAYTMGFNANYQCGQGSDDDIEVATMIDNTATRDKKLVWAGAGGQFTVLAGLAGQ
jgi:regulator of chromosome condensation